MLKKWSDFLEDTEYGIGMMNAPGWIGLGLWHNDNKVVDQNFKGSKALKEIQDYLLTYFTEALDQNLNHMKMEEFEEEDKGLEMNTPVRKTYAEFLLPDPEAPGEVIFSLREVPYGDRNPDVPPGRPVDAIGVRFFDQLTVDAEDPKTNEGIRCISKRLDVDQGVTFYDGDILTTDDLKNPTRTKIPRQTVATIMMAMKKNGWDTIVYFPDNRVALPYDEYLDKIHTV